MSARRLLHESIATGWDRSRLSRRSLMLAGGMATCFLILILTFANVGAAGAIVTLPLSLLLAPFQVVSAALSFSPLSGAETLPIRLPVTTTKAHVGSLVNATLDFQQIYVVHEEHRWNRRDEMSLMAASQGIKVQYAKAPRPFELSYAGLPWHPQESVGATQLAQFRAHANIWREMVDNNIASAFIMEDDTDWDENLKTQLQTLREPLAKLITSTDQSGDARRHSSKQNDPYLSQDWDMLFLGACSETPFTDEDHPSHLSDSHKSPPFASYPDVGVASCEELHEGQKSWLQYQADNSHDSNLQCAAWQPSFDNAEQVFGAKHPRRAITRAHKPRCLSSYAISLRGATKALLYLSRGIDAPLDEALGHLAELDLLRGYTVIPALTGTWKDEDWTMHKNPSKGRSVGIRNSLRRNLKRVLLHM